MSKNMANIIHASIFLRVNGSSPFRMMRGHPVLSTFAKSWILQSELLQKECKMQFSYLYVLTIKASMLLIYNIFIEYFRRGTPIALCPWFPA